MGCWNETCGFSGQSISEDEKVTAFLILLNEKPYRDVYAGGIASPIAFPIEAEYDDYGSIENPVLGFATESALKLFNQWYKEEKLIISEEFFKDVEGDSCGRDLDSDKDECFKTIETLFYAIEREYVLLKHRHAYESRYVNRTVAFMMVRQDVLDTAIEVVLGAGDYAFRDVSLENYNLEVQHMIDEYLSKNDRTDSEKAMVALSNMIESLKDKPDSADKIKELQSILTKKLTHTFSRPWGGEDCESPIEGRHYNACYRMNRYESVDTESFRILFNITKELFTPEINDDVKQSIIKFLLTGDVFTLFRKSWIPQAHASQCDNFLETIEYMERMLTKMYAKRIEKYKDGWWEEEFTDNDVYNHPTFEKKSVGNQASAKLIELTPEILKAATELAEYASYSEIIGAIGHNKPQIRQWCDEVYKLNATLRGEKWEPPQ